MPYYLKKELNGTKVGTVVESYLAGAFFTIRDKREKKDIAILSESEKNDYLEYREQKT